MLNNNGNALGLYDEMSTMYEQLDVYKHAGSRQDRLGLHCWSYTMAVAGLGVSDRYLHVFLLQLLTCLGSFNQPS